MSLNTEPILQSLIEKTEQRYFGKYRAYVEDNEDPRHLGRLRLRVPSLLGAELVSGWATPCAPYAGASGEAFLFLPEPGAGVWAEFEEGDLEKPIWSGAFWSEADGDSELPPPNDAEGNEAAEHQSPPTRKIIRTAKGHTIQIEDLDGEEMITIVHWKDRDADEKNLVVLDAKGIRLVDYTGNVLDMNSEEFRITSMVPFKIDASGQPVEILAQSIDLNKA